MRAIMAAAVQVAPSSGPLKAESIAANTRSALAKVRECHAATGAELIVLPETVTTGFTTGVSAEQLWDPVTELPGPIMAPYADAAAEPGIQLVFGTYERGP